MKQVLQSLRDGGTQVANVAAPACSSGELLIRSKVTLVSAGTERMLVDFGKAGWVSKARQQPDKVRMVLDKVRTDGLAPTLEAVFSKLEQPLPLGYCNVGEIVSVGRNVSEFGERQRVVSNGKHAEVVSVPRNLCAAIPDAVSDEEASFTVLGAIGLQGVRLVNPTLGECVVVIGLGLIGLITVQLLRANGCRVLGVDFDSSKLELARQFGAETVDLSAGQDVLASASKFSRGRGVDAVLITASTKSNEPVRQAAQMSRKRGRIVLVGVTGLELSRADFYEKELSFQVSCSYGPGRYDPEYEEAGFDYPVGFVRWTEQRNFEAVLDMMASGALDVKPMISHRFSIDDVAEAYELVSGSAPALGILLEYPDRGDEALSATVAVEPASRAKTIVPGGARIGFVGSGNYATSVLIPAFAETGAELVSVSSRAGVSGFHVARKFGIQTATTDTDALLADDAVDAVVISTRHDSHADMVLKGLQGGKHVFVEKPLCLDMDELRSIGEAADGVSRHLMVGFNRRFSPLVVKMKSLLEQASGPMSLTMTVNAGAIPADHWTQDPKVGGGRIVGEGCHFIDLLRHLVGRPVMAWSRHSMDSQCSDTTTIVLKFEDGSIGTIHYFANGNRAVAKERLEVFVGGKVLHLDNFRSLRGWGWKGFSKTKLWRQDKGQKACAQAFVDSITKGRASPIPLDEVLEVSRLSIEIAQG